MGGYSLIRSLILRKLKSQNTKAEKNREVREHISSTSVLASPSASQPSWNTKFNVILPALPLFSKVVVCIKGRVMSCQSNDQGLIHGFLPWRTELFLQ